MNLKRNSNQTHPNVEKQRLENVLQSFFIQAMKGEVKAYESFLGTVSVLVKRNLYFLMRNNSHMDLEDMHQEIMLKIHHKKHTYQLGAPMIPWIKAVTKYSTIDFYRSQKKRLNEVVFEDIFFEELVEESADDFKEIMNHLTEKQQEIIRMVKIEGATHALVAKSMNMTISSVKVSVHRIIKTLKTRMK